MKEIFFIRHAEALPLSMLEKAEDSASPLSPKGRQQALNLAAFVKEFHFLPDKVLCSTALRARQTLAYLKPSFSLNVEINYEQFVYENSLEEFCHYLEQQPESVKKLCIVGHNSLIEQCLDFLLPPEEKIKLIPFKNASIAVLKNSAEEWFDFPDVFCTLEAFFSFDSL